VCYKDPDVYIESKYFDEAAIFYDMTRRNAVVLGRGGAGAAKADLFDW
jgi:hypothetical protein